MDKDRTPNHEANVRALKKWAEEHYEQGGDMMVECWETSDYDELLDGAEGNYYKALDILKRVASVHAERQADAAYYARGEQDVGN
jgi:hypothetical protein